MKLILCALADTGLKFCGILSRLTCVTLRLRSWTSKFCLNFLFEVFILNFLFEVFISLYLYILMDHVNKFVCW